MKKNMTTVTFKGTPEQEAQLLEVIAKYKGVEGALMPVLQQAQEIYGYLPEEVQSIISAELDIPLAEIYGVSTFYSRFTLNPKGENRISVCMGTACYVKGAADILAEIEGQIGCKAGSVTPDGRFSIDADRCVGACGLAPIVIVNGDVYGHVTVDQVEGILAKYRGEVE